MIALPHKWIAAVGCWGLGVRVRGEFDGARTDVMGGGRPNASGFPYKVQGDVESTDLRDQNLFPPGIEPGTFRV